MTSTNKEIQYKKIDGEDLLSNRLEHHYAHIDQQNTQRVKLVNQPGAYINCHTAETPELIQELNGKNLVNKMFY